MKKILIVITLFMQLSAMAFNGIDIADNRYKDFINFKHRSKISSVESAKMSPLWQNKEKTLFIYPNKDARGMVLVSGVANSRAILGYVDSGEFDISNIPDGLKAMLEQYAAELSLINANNNGVNDTNLEDCYVEPVEPLLGEIAWDQGYPYNLMCPIYMGDTPSATGCVATAMAQIMYYYKYPEVGVGSHSYTPEVHEYMGEQFVDFTQSFYEWDNMQPYYRGGETESSKLAVAKLMYDCGVAVNMQYSSQSGANSPDWPEALTSHFSYDKGVSLRRRIYYDSREWDRVILEELYAGRPVYVTGFTDGAGGHAFVFDGCDDQGLFHVNWGWSGMSNGYFVTTALTPSSQGVGGSVGGFNYNQVIITGITPAEEDSFIVPELVSEESLTAPASAVKTDLVAVKLNGRVKNVGWKDVEVEFAVMVYDAEGNSVAISSVSEKESIEVNGSCRKISIAPMDLSTLEDGSYVLRPVCRVDEKAPWVHVRDMDLAYPNKLNLIVEGDKLIFSNLDLPLLKGEFMDVPQKIVAAQTTCVKIKLSNVGESEYYGSLRGLILDKDTRKKVATASEIMVDISAGEEKIIEMLMPFTEFLPAGDYILEIEDNAYKKITGGKNIYIEEFIAEAEIESISVPVIENSENVDPLEVNATASLKCVSGIFTDQILLYFFVPGTEEIKGCIGPVFACIPADEEMELQFSGPFENALPDTDYEAVLVDGRYISYVKPRELAKTKFHVKASSSVEKTDVKSVPVEFYSTSGVKVEKPSCRGIYIVKYSDGKIEKQIIKY